MAGLTNKKGNIRKTVHQYNRHFAGNFGQVRDHLVIEATWLGNFEPFTFEVVGSYILDIMNLAGQESFIEEYGLQSFKVKSLSVERTFCEKIMSLVRFSRTDDPIASLVNKIRHVYDLHLMLSSESISTFFKGDEFLNMLQKVGSDDFISYRNNNLWLREPPCNAIIFEKPEMTWNRIRNAYRTIFKNLVFGELPSESDLITTLQKIGRRMKNIDWKI